MKYLLNGDKNYVITLPDNQRPLGSGNEGIVYLIGGMAIKIINSKSWMDEEKAIYLSESSQVTLVHLPIAPLYTLEGVYSGYAMRYIADDNIAYRDLKCAGIIKSTKILTDDVDKLAEQKISLYDPKIKNIIIRNGLINVIDSDRFQVPFSFKRTFSDEPEEYRKSSLAKLNFLGKAIYTEIIESATYGYEVINREFRHFALRQAEYAYQGGYMISYLQNELNGFDTPKEYVAEKRETARKIGMI